MFQGIVIEVAQVDIGDNDMTFVDCRQHPESKCGACGHAITQAIHVHTDENTKRIEIGDRVWWNYFPNGLVYAAHWTPQGSVDLGFDSDKKYGVDYEIPLKPCSWGNDRFGMVESRRPIDGA